jgi:drug/metabolite transporter (DMT)-like permease
VTLLLAVVQRQEKLHLWAVVGTLLSVAGIAIVSGASTGETIPLPSLLALVGAAFCFAEAAVLVRQFPPVHPVVMNGVGAVSGAVFLFAGSFIAGEDLILPRKAETWVAIGYLAAIGSVVVFVLYVIVIREWNAPRASYTFVVVPIVTVVLSAWLDGEKIGLELVAGGLLVLAGVYVGALRPAHMAAAAAAEA